MTGRFRGRVRSRSFVQIHMNWQLVKYVRFVRVSSYEFVRNSHLVKYVRIAVRSGFHISPQLLTQKCGPSTHMNQRGVMLLNVMRKYKPCNILRLCTANVVACIDKGKLSLKTVYTLRLVSNPEYSGFTVLHCTLHSYFYLRICEVNNTARQV